MTAAGRPAAALQSTRTLGRSSGDVSVRRRPRDPGVPIDYAALSGDPGSDAVATKYEAGFEAGYAAGEANAQAEVDEVARQSRVRVERALEALERATSAAGRAFADRQGQLEHSLTEFAFELVETLFGRELELSADPGRDAVERALAIDDTGLPATVRLHPQDVDALGDMVALGGSRAVTVIADPSVEPGGALVDIGEATIDSQLSRALERVRSLLVGDGGRGEP